MVKAEKIISVREVRNELTGKFNDDKINSIAKQKDKFFANPTPEEISFITQIYSVKHFRPNLDKKKILSGGFFADPFVIAQAWKDHATLVIE